MEIGLVLLLVSVVVNIIAWFLIWTVSEKQSTPLKLAKGIV